MKTYRLHIRTIHPNVQPEELKKLSAPPNPLMIEVNAGNDKNTTCTICGKTILAEKFIESTWLEHIRMVIEYLQHLLEIFLKQ